MARLRGIDFPATIADKSAWVAAGRADPQTHEIKFHAINAAYWGDAVTDNPFTHPAAREAWHDMYVQAAAGLATARRRKQNEVPPTHQAPPPVTQRAVPAQTQRAAPSGTRKAATEQPALPWYQQGDMG